MAFAIAYKFINKQFGIFLNYKLLIYNAQLLFNQLPHSLCVMYVLCLHEKCSW